VIEARLRTKIPRTELEQKIGKILTPSDVNIKLTGPSRILMPDGRPLCIYLPRAVEGHMNMAAPILRGIKMKTDNRGLASGSVRANAGGKRSRSMPVMSGVMGAMDPAGTRHYCRLTTFTRDHIDQWEGLHPMLQHIASQMQQHVPERWMEQVAVANKTHPDWVVPDTPFTTITVNNSYSTGVHTDKGDLDAGFSCLAVLRDGDYSGGWICFPEYRVGVDMQHGDLLLMDAHQWHGNTKMICKCGQVLSAGPCMLCGSQRISVVCYYRTKMQSCSSSTAESRKRAEQMERRASATA
jgi:hypothetical protein